MGRVHGRNVSVPAPMTPTKQNTPLAAGIPVHLSGFIGRDRELADVVALVDSVRLVTLTGGGGSGKTRLAAEAAARATSFARVIWVDLSPLAAPELLAQHVATTLQVPERDTTTPLQTLIDSVGDQRALHRARQL